MNERIKELWDLSRNPSGRGHDEQKFAELIVAECAHVAVFKDSGMVSSAHVAGYMAAGRSIAAKLIKEHFELK